MLYVLRGLIPLNTLLFLWNNQLTLLEVAHIIAILLVGTNEMVSLWVIGGVFVLYMAEWDWASILMCMIWSGIEWIRWFDMGMLLSLLMWLLK